jgi:hypothetical protein
MKKITPILLVLNLLLLSGILIRSVSTETAERGLPKKNTADSYLISAVKIPEHLDFAGEEVPLDDPDVFERVDREIHVNTYWQSSTLLLIKRSHKYFPIIEPILAREGIPDDFKYLAVAESSLMNVTSPSGAKGFWQLLKATGKEYGLEVNSNVDERYHLEKATLAACNYLKKAKERFGSWTMAAASYNAGMSRVAKRIDQQKTEDYYQLFLNDETARYIPRIVVYKEILTHPEAYGFSFDNDDLYKPMSFSEVEVDTAITNLTGFANKFGMNYKELKLLNPWLREPHLNNKSRKLYHIKVK